jgi:hypothetical protein
MKTWRCKLELRFAGQVRKLFVKLTWLHCVQHAAGNQILCVVGEFRQRRMENRSQAVGFVAFVPWRLIGVSIVAWGRRYSYGGCVSCVFIRWRQAEMIPPWHCRQYASDPLMFVRWFLCVVQCGRVWESEPGMSYSVKPWTWSFGYRDGTLTLSVPN